MVQSGSSAAWPSARLALAKSAGWTAGSSACQFGNSQKPAFTPPLGRRCTNTFPRQAMMKPMNRRLVAATLLAKAGMVSTLFSLRAKQRPFSGQLPQSGLRGVQISAPSSIIAWLKAEAFRCLGFCSVTAYFTSSSATDQRRSATGLAFGDSSIPSNRVSTRATLPSTIGSAWLNAMLQTAPPV